MSTDISVYAEKRDQNGEWCQIEGVFEAFGFKNYAAFDWLAAARGQYLISPEPVPRGIPNDACVSVRTKMDEMDDLYHDHSWCSLKELLEIDYEQPVTIDFGNPEITTYVFEGPHGPTPIHVHSYRVTIGPATSEQSVETVRRTTLREFLGQEFFDDLQGFVEMGAERLIFAFDS